MVGYVAWQMAYECQAVVIGSDCRLGYCLLVCVQISSLLELFPVKLNLCTLSHYANPGYQSSSLPLGKWFICLLSTELGTLYRLLHKFSWQLSLLLLLLSSRIPLTLCNWTMFNKVCLTDHAENSLQVTAAGFLMYSLAPVVSLWIISSGIFTGW